MTNVVVEHLVQVADELLVPTVEPVRAVVEPIALRSASWTAIPPGMAVALEDGDLVAGFEPARRLWRGRPNRPPGRRSAWKRGGVRARRNRANHFCRSAWGQLASRIPNPKALAPVGAKRIPPPERIRRLRRKARSGTNGSSTLAGCPARSMLGARWNRRAEGHQVQSPGPVPLDAAGGLAPRRGRRRRRCLLGVPQGGMPGPRSEDLQEPPGGPWRAGSRTRMGLALAGFCRLRSRPGAYLRAFSTRLTRMPFDRRRGWSHDLRQLPPPGRTARSWPSPPPSSARPRACGSPGPGRLRQIAAPPA